MNTIYKVVWNKTINAWAAASELAKGRQKTKSTQHCIHDTNQIPTCKKSKLTKKKSITALVIMSALLSNGAYAQSTTVNDYAAFKSALLSGLYSTITLGANIIITDRIDIILNGNSVVIDGQGSYGLRVNSGDTNGIRVITSQSGVLTLQNMTEIYSTNYYSMVNVDGGNNNPLNVIYNNIDSFNVSQHGFMGGNGQNTNQILTFGNMGTVADVTRQEIAEANTLVYTGKYHVKHTNGTVSFHNTSATDNTASMVFKSGADVKIDRTGTTADITRTGSSGIDAFTYLLEDGSAFEFIANQNVLSGTTTNRGLKIGTYDTVNGFGTGAKIVVTSRSDGSLIAGNGIDNATINTTGINNGATQNGDVIYNLATGSAISVALNNSAIYATKTGAANSGNLYLRSAGTLTGVASSTAGAGIYAAHAGTGNIVIENGTDGNINFLNALNITHSGTGRTDVTNKGILQSTVNSVVLLNQTGTGGVLNFTNAGTITGVNTAAAIVLSVTNAHNKTIQLANQGSISGSSGFNLTGVLGTSNITVGIDNTGGTINANGASGGAAINIANGTVNFNLTGGTLNLGGAANGISITNAAASTNSVTNTVINVNGTGSAIAKTNANLLTLSGTTINVNTTGIGLTNITGITFAAGSQRNAINVTSTGTGIAVANTALAGWSPAALDLTVSGAGTGISATGGGVDFGTANLVINVTNSSGTGLVVADGAGTTTIGPNAQINATGATAINFSGTTQAKTLVNNGTINGAVVFAGAFANSITNNGTLSGTMTTGAGDDSLTLNANSISSGTINLGDGNNHVYIYTGANITSVITGAGDDIFDLNNLGAGTVLGALNAGTGNNILNFNTSNLTLGAGTALQSFSTVNLNTNSVVTLSNPTNLTGGVVNIDAASQLRFASGFTGTLAATLGHVGAGDGGVFVNTGAQLTLSGSSASYAGTWNVITGGILNVSADDQLGAATSTVAVAGTGNLNYSAATFNHILTGNGALNVNVTGPFSFGLGVGSAFGGTVNLTNATFVLSNNNTTALTNATLKLSTDNITTVGATGTSSTQSIGNLTLNGGILAFATGGNAISTGSLTVPIATTIRVDGASIVAGGSLLDQDTGSAPTLLVASSRILDAGEFSRLALQNLSGGALAAVNDYIQGSNTVHAQPAASPSQAVMAQVQRA